VTVLIARGYIAAMPYGDQRFRHDLRNTLNSFSLAIRAYEISNEEEQIELLDLIVNSADEAIAIFDRNPPEEDGPLVQS
jgi:hypothetical protein